MKLVWTSVAKRDIQSIYEYIARDSVYYAGEYTDKLINSVERLKEFPYSGRVVPEIGDINVREIIYGSYRLMYHVDETADTVSITQVSHGAQEFKIHE
jgi:addiction module RelE/StbE family toxin